MSPRRTLKSLQNVAAIRSFQQSVQEQKVALAATEVARLMDGRSQAADHAEQSLTSWMEHHQVGVLDLALSAALGRAMLAADGRLADAGAALQAGEQAKERQTQALREAQARREAAEQLRDRMARKARRLMEERRLSELADRTAFRRRGP